MSIIIPTVIGYEVCEYTHKSSTWSAMSQQVIKDNLSKRQFKVVKYFDNLEDARKMLEEDRNPNTQETPYVLRYIFKEIEPDDSVH